MTPETEVAQAALNALPASWISPAFSDTILDCASLQAVHRMVGERVAAATEAANAAVTALVAQDPSDAALSEVVATQQTLTALSDVRAILPPISIDASACAQAVAAAGGALSQVAPRAPIVLDYADEMVQWRNFTHSSSRAAVDAPVASDQDRAAATSRDEAAAAVTGWMSWLALWRSLDPKTDVMNTLASAAGQIGKAGEVADAVEQANKVTNAANIARRDAHLNWSAS